MLMKCLRSILLLFHRSHICLSALKIILKQILEQTAPLPVLKLQCCCDNEVSPMSH